VTLTVVVEYLAKKDYNDIPLPGGIIIVLLVIFLLRKTFGSYIEYLTLLVIFAYNLYRLFVMETTFDKASKSSQFFSGYTYAVLQVILISRMTKTSYQILAIAATFALRFSMIYGWISSESTSPGTIIRAIIVDSFVLYYFYFRDKSSRQVFKSFYEKRDELLKFKELLDDSLPIGVVIIDCLTYKALFSNKAFQKTFERRPTEILSQFVSKTNRKSSPQIEEGNSQLDLCQVDSANLNELMLKSSTLKRLIKYLDSDGILDLNTIIKNLIIEDNLLSHEALTIPAFFSYQGQRRSFEVKVKKTTWNGFEAVAVLLNDTTDQENLLALKVANANKDKIIGTVSHELRTPLNGILGLLGMAEKMVDNPEARGFITLSKDNAQLLLSLVNSHLDLQQIGSGKLRLNPSRITLDKVLTDITCLLQFQTNQKGISLDFQIDKDVHPYVNTDENRLKQILINLIGNAVKFTLKGGIKVLVTQDADDPKCIRISVNDTGIGIKKEDIAKLFTTFGRLDDGRKVNRNGVGLGLTIANVLAALLSGREGERGIEVTSQYGEGSQFFFKILKDLDDETKSPKPDLPILNHTVEKSFSEKETIPYEFLEESSLQNIGSKLATYISLKKSNVHELKTRKSSTSKIAIRNINNTSLNLVGRMDSELSEENRLNQNNQSFACSSFNPAKHIVIVVDDNPFNVLVTTSMLQDLSFLTKSALGGKEAIELVQKCTKEKQTIKVILMDCQMPIMDGFQTSQILKQMMDKKEIPVIPILALTANDLDETIVKRCLETGMEGYLTKPTSQEALLKAFTELK